MNPYQDPGMSGISPAMQGLLQAGKIPSGWANAFRAQNMQAPGLDGDIDAANNMKHMMALQSASWSPQGDDLHQKIQKARAMAGLQSLGV